jgi:hypothetical protein
MTRLAVMLLALVASLLQSTHADASPAATSQSFDQRTLFHLFPTSLASPLHTASTLAHLPGASSSAASHPSWNQHAGHGVNARASSAVKVMTFAKEFRADGKQEEDRLPILAVPESVELVQLSEEWSVHPQLNRLVQLQCGLSMMEYCTDGPEEGQDPLDWAHMKFDRPCVLPIVRQAANSAPVNSLHQISAVAVLLFLPQHSTSHPSPHHAHASHTSHHGLPHSRSEQWKQCQISLANEFELDGEEGQEEEQEQHMEWIDEKVGQASEEARFFSEFSTSHGDWSPSVASSIWTASDIPAYMASVYRQYQVASTGRKPLEVAPHVDNQAFYDGVQNIVERSAAGGDSSAVNGSSEIDPSSTIFLETRSQVGVDVLDRTSVMNELHAREMADTNDLYRLMGQLTDATRTGASATVVWELVIRPCVNILRKQLLDALKQLMAKMLIKGLTALVTGIINPHSPPPDSSSYTKPPVAVVEDPEKLWSSLPAVIPEAIVPPPESGTELAQLQVDDSVFLAVEHVHSVSGILDPLLDFVVPVIHNTVTQATHDIAQKGMGKSIQMHSIAPMKAQIHAGVHRKSVEMLTEQLTQQVSEAVTKDLIAQLPRTLTILCSQDIHKALSRPLTLSLVQGLTFSLTRSHLQDQECEEGKPACEVTKSVDYYTNFYGDYYATYFERYYTFYYTEWYARLFANDQLAKG